MATTTLNVKGMTCDHCKRAVEEALNRLDGVKKATVDLKANTATIKYDDDRVKLEHMKEVVAEEGYDLKV